MEIRGKFMSLIMSIRWIKRMKRFRPNLNEIYRQKIRHRFTFGALVSNDNAKIKSYKMIKLSMNNCMRCIMPELLKRLHMPLRKNI